MDIRQGRRAGYRRRSTSARNQAARRPEFLIGPEWFGHRYDSIAGKTKARSEGGLGLRVLLVGAGHAHLHVIRQARALRSAGVDLVLISPATFRYSGLATGALSGVLEVSAPEIDVAALAAAFGVIHFDTTVDDIDITKRQARLAKSAAVTFDAVSFNVGSAVRDPNALQAEPGVWPVKPLAALIGLHTRLDLAISANGHCPDLVIAGGGPTGLEIAAALCGLCERRAVTPRIKLVETAPSAGWAAPEAIRRLRAGLDARGVTFRVGRVVARSPGACRTDSGDELPCADLVLATGLIGAGLVGNLGLPTDADGRLRVTPRLQSVADARVFAVGDCAVIDAAPRPCVGVFGVRAAPVLVHNLKAIAQGAALRSYRPQRRWLAILDLGDGTGLALRGRAWWIGRSALRLKRWLDLRFVRKTRAAPAKVKRTV